MTTKLSNNNTNGGNGGDGCWTLNIEIKELKINKSLRVNGDLHIGALMVRLVDSIQLQSYNWSDYAFWCQNKRLWLTRTKMTLDQYGIQSDCKLLFTRIHKQIKLQLPDMQVVDVYLDFSQNILNNLYYICKEIGIKHPEELSFMKFLNQNNATSKAIKNGAGGNDSGQISINNLNNLIINDDNNSNNGNFGGGDDDTTNCGTSDDLTINDSSSSTTANGNGNSNGNGNGNGNGSNGYDDYTTSIDLNNKHNLSLSPIKLQTNIHHKLKQLNIKYKSIFDKAKQNELWLDSSKSLMEQDICENDVIKLKFKYYAFYDLNVKYDLIRINQIYEQAKWSILSEEIDCTDEELIKFAALQLQIYIKSKQAYEYNERKLLNNGANSSIISNGGGFSSGNSSSLNGASHNNGVHQTAINNGMKRDEDNEDDEDDVDTALSKLEKTLEQSSITTPTQTSSSSTTTTTTTSSLIASKLTQQQALIAQSIQDLTQFAELCEELQLMKQKYTFKKFKTYYFMFSDTYLSYFKCKEDLDAKRKPIDKWNIRNCEVTPDLNVHLNKYAIYLKLMNQSDIIELYIKCPNETSYCKWLAAFKLASKSKTMHKDSQLYKTEIESIKNLIDIQKKTGIVDIPTNELNQPQQQHQQQQKQNTSTVISNDDFQVQNFVTKSLFKKYKLKQLTDRIIETHSNLTDLDLIEAKLRYIKTWQALPNYGITYFVVRYKSSKYKEEIFGVSSNRLFRIGGDGEIVKQWRLDRMQTWFVNWDNKEFEIMFDEEVVKFNCLHNLNAKIVHEFIGGYIYMSLRVNNVNSNIDVNEQQKEFLKLTDKR